MHSVGVLARVDPASRDDIDELAEFYASVFDRELRPGAADRLIVEVEDLESTLTRVWDFGGTIVSAPESIGDAGATATVLDPSGRLVSIRAAAF